MIQLAAFWKRDSKGGRTYYQGKLGNGRLLLFRNDKKQDDKSPDLICYIVEDKSKEEGKQPPKDYNSKEDIPF